MASIKLSIAEPCHENWNTMLPEDKGRFCLSCQKTVVDFTAMSDRQVFDYFKNYKGYTCGQFNNDQLDREMTRPKTYSIGRWKYFWQILLPAFFAFQKVEAQPKQVGKIAIKPICKPEKVQPATIRLGLVASPQPAKKSGYQIIGTLLNDKKEPIPFATITSSDGKYAVADSIGRFKIALNERAILTISQVGYTEKNFTIDSLQTNNIAGLKFENGQLVIETVIRLQQEEVKIPDVAVIGYGSTRGKLSLGGSVSIVTRCTIFTRPKTVLPDHSLPQLTIFPNPIQPGQNFQITYQVKKTGNYLLKIIDAAGRIVIEEKRNITNKMQTETINGFTLQQPGIYFITLINTAYKKGTELQGRIVVQ